MKADAESGRVIDIVKRRLGFPVDLDFGPMQERLLADARRQAGGQPLDAYDRLVDQAAQKMAVDLPKLDKVKSANHKQVLIVGDVVSEAKISDPQLETALRELSGKLQENELMRQRFVFVGMTTKAAKAASDAAGAGEAWEFTDPLSDNPGTSKIKYDPSSIYTLTGRFRRETSMAESIASYSLFVEVSQASSRETVKTYTLKDKYHFHPYLGKWITDAENERLRQKFDARDK